jgi:hypothetical protein
MLYRRIAFGIIAALLAGCAADSATFTLDRGVDDTSVDLLVSLEIFMTSRTPYVVGDIIAKTDEHLRVFAFYYNEIAREIPLKDVRVTLRGEEIFGESGEYEITETRTLGFEKAGKKTLVAYYGGLKAEYVFYVGFSDGSSGETGTTIEIKPVWPEDR